MNQLNIYRDNKLDRKHQAKQNLRTIVYGFIEWFDKQSSAK